MGIQKRRTPAPKKNTVAGETPPVGPPWEFRNGGDDDAWYSVNLVLQGETLIVKYREFPGDPDEEFHAGDLTTVEEITALWRRFRPLSKQLEVSDCRMVQEGMRVCALREFAEDDRRYYDAIVEAVKHEEHTIVNGEEKCSCSFVLSWMHGPESGTLTSARVEDLCPIQSRTQIDPRLACFLEIAKWKHGINLLSSRLLSEDAKCNQESPISFFLHKHLCINQKSKNAMEIGNALLDDEGKSGYERNEDVDLGGGDDVLTNLKLTDGNHLFLADKAEAVPYINLEGGEYVDARSIEKASSQPDKNGHQSSGMEKLMEDVSYLDLEQRDQDKTNVVHRNASYIILVENLEKDLSPPTIVDFVREATCVEVEAFIFLSLSSEPYTRGALVVDSLEELKRVCDFVAKPDEMITSSKGRPWIVSNSSATEWVRPSFWCLEPNLENTRPHSTGTELRIVKFGSEEYCRAVKLRDLYMEFAKHQEQLFKRLALEEENIFNSSLDSGSQR